MTAALAGVAFAQDLAAPPAPAPSWPRARLELTGAMASHSDSQRGPSSLDAETSGWALSRLMLRGQWLTQRWPVGLSLELAFARLVLSGEESGAISAFNLATFETSVAAGATGRLSLLGGRLLLGGTAGYALHRIPMLDVTDGRVSSGALLAHGPALGVEVGVRVGRLAVLEARGDMLPASLGADFAGRSSDFSRFSGGLSAVIGPWERGRIGWSAVAGYQVQRWDTSGDDHSAGGTRHLLQVGVRASLLPPVAAVPLPPPPNDPVLKQGQKPGGIRILLLAGTGTAERPGAPIAGAVASVNGLPPFQSSAAGELVISPAGPGPVPVVIRASGWKTVEEIVSVPPGGEASLRIVLQPARAVEDAVLKGVVRASDTGEALTATVAVPELHLEVQAGADGTFQLAVPPGAYTLRFTAPGFASQTKTVRVISSEQAIFNIDLHRF